LEKFRERFENGEFTRISIHIYAVMRNGKAMTFNKDLWEESSDGR